MTAPGGVYINYDVVAPDDKEKIVYILLTDTDGSNPDDVHPDVSADALPDFLSSLSTKARFRRFLKDFRAVEGDQVICRWETIEDEEYAVLRFADACDFLAKKDYVQSWHSEMHERFCFWEYADWVEALSRVGFVVSEGSETKQNPWLIEHRFAPAARIFARTDDGLVQLDYPVTNVLLVARKPF